jgi:RNA polymerase primary sigma factor
MLKWFKNSEIDTHENEESANIAVVNTETRSYLHNLTRQRLLNFEEECDLSRKIQAGDLAARDRLVEANMRLVLNIARSYHTQLLPFEDLVQEGAIGLVTAAERYDPGKGYRFSTYATHWIRQSISRAVDNKSKAIRIPAHVTETLRKVERFRTAYLREKGEEPSTDVIAQGLGISLRKVNQLLQTNFDPISLDTLVGTEENTTLAALLNDANAENPQEVILTEEMQKELDKLLSVLTPREREVMCRRMGFEGDANVLQEIGEKLQISRERVRQIELQALRKLKYAARRRDLYGYITD